MGGFTNYSIANFLSSAELYDPTSGTWTAAGTLNAARGGHTATLLPSGKVLIAGGDNGTSYLSSAELYDPATGTWTTTFPSIAARSYQTATLLPSGKVLVAGGGSSSAEIFDSRSATVTLVGNLSCAYDGTAMSLSATTTPLGLAVNLTYNGSPNAPVNVGSYTVIGTISDPYYQGSTTNTLVISKGTAAVTLVGSLSYTYDGTAKSLSATTTPPGLTVNLTYNGSSSAPINAGSYTVVGTVIDGNYLGSATSTLAITKATATGALGNLSQVYDGTAKSVSTTTTPPGLTVSVTYNGSPAAPIAVGNYIVLGTINDQNYQGSAGINALQIIPNPSFLTNSPMGTARSAHTATLLPNGKVLVAGGTSYDASHVTFTYLRSVEQYDPATGAWTASASLITGRQNHTATLLPNGKVLVAGGYDGGNGLASAELYDPATGTWMAAAAMLGSGGAGATATLLQNGKVLVVGGSFYTPSGGTGHGYWDYRRYVSLYDPSNGTWAGSQLTTARSSHTATLLPNGKVLVAGGLNGTYSSGLASAEIYDPTTGTWTPTGSLTAARSAHSAALLPNGKVLVAGGGNTISLSSAELYNPATGTWTATGAMTDARQNHTATLLNNGNVLVAAGYNGSYLARVELYSPTTGTWTPAGALTTTRSSHTATLLLGGKVLFAGGNSSASVFPYPWTALSSTELYVGRTAIVTMGNLSQGYDGTPKTVSVTTTPPGLTVNLTYNGSSSAPINVGSYTVIGTVTDGSYQGSATNTLVISKGTATVAFGNLSQVYDGTAKSVSATTTPPGLTVSLTYNGASNAPISAGSYTVIGTVTDGSYQGGATNTLVISKATATVTLGNLTQMYDGTAKSVSTTTTPLGLTLNLTYDGSPSAPINEGNYTVVGTVIDLNYQGSATNILSVILEAPAFITTGPMSNARCGHTATLLPNGKVLAAGGAGYDGNPLSSAELYDPVAATWTATGAMTTSRAGHAAVLLSSGKVLVVGGSGGAGSGYLSSAELYDPGSGRWTATGAQPTAGWDPRATLLSSGEVLVAGGRISSAPFYLSSGEIYNPITGAWMVVGSMAQARYRHTATLLRNGKALVAGGGGGFATQVLCGVELYDPVSGTWTATGPLNTARTGHMAVLLSDGRVLVAGGSGDLSSAELYDPNTGVWTVTGTMITARSGYFTTTLLPGGKVLVVGGSNGRNFGLSSAELYAPATESWVATCSLTTARTLHTSTLLPNGKLLVVGGFDSSYVRLSSAELYHPVAGAPAPAMLTNLVKLTNGAFQFAFRSTPSMSFTALATTNMSLPLSNWTVLGGVMEILPGWFQFADPQATNTPKRFYRIRSP